MRVRIVSVEPLHESNLGYIARVMANFGLYDLAVVRPRCDPRGEDAIKYSKHGHKVIERLRVFESIDRAVHGYLPIGTTAIWHKTERAKFNVLELSDAMRIISGRGRRGRIAIVLGRDDTGLTKEELELFSMNIFISTGSTYPTLNISHALGIILYKLRDVSNRGRGAHIGEEFRQLYASDRDIALLKRQLELFVSSLGSVRERKGVVDTTIRLIMRSNPTKTELRTISAMFSIKGRRERESRKR